MKNKILFLLLAWILMSPLCHAQGLDQGTDKWTFYGNDQYSQNSGNVGVGTQGPVPQKLYVVGNIQATGSILGGNNAINSSEINWSNVNGLAPINSGGINWNNVNGLNPINNTGINWTSIPTYATGAILDATSANGVNWSSNMLINGTTTTFNQGNVGVGSTAPGSLMDVQGTMRIVGPTTVSQLKFYSQGTANHNGIGYNGAGQSNSGLSFWSFSDTREATFWDNGSLSIGSNSNYYNHDTNANGLVVQGNVGIGTYVPGMQLDVSGTIRGTTFASGANTGVTGSGGTSCLCKAFTGGICTTIGTCT